MRSAIATGVFLLLLATFIAAGLWQLDRAGQKHDLQAAFTAGTVVNPVLKPVSDADAADYRFRRFELWGRFVPEQQILLESMVANGRNGYQVITPFYTQGQTVLVNRGWLPANSDRRILPTVDVGDEERSIDVRLNALPVPGMRMENRVEPGIEWPRRMLYPTRDDIATAIGTPVPDYQLLLAADQPDGYLREWQAVGVGPTKHYGYAIQWFAFAVLALFFYVLLNIRWNNEHKAMSADEKPPQH